MSAALSVVFPPATRVTVPRPLRARWIDLIRDGNQGDYATDAAAAMATAIAMNRAGHSYSDFARELSEPGNRLSAFYRRKDDGRPRHNPATVNAKMRRDWDKAARYTAANPQTLDRSEARQHLGLARAALRTSHLGRSNVRNAQVLTTLISLGEDRGTVTPAVSERTLAELTGKARKTVAAALGDLVGRGWLIRERSSDPGVPTMYRICVPDGAGGGGEAGVSNPPISLSLPRGDTAGRVLNTLGTWQHADPRERVNVGLAQILTPQAALVYAALDGEVALTPTALIAVTGVARATAYRWLKVLAGMGLAVRRAAGWLAGAADPDVVAAEHGVAQIEIDRVHRHAVEREGWRLFQAARRAGARVVAAVARVVRPHGRTQKSIMLPRTVDTPRALSPAWGRSGGDRGGRRAKTLPVLQ